MKGEDKSLLKLMDGSDNRFIIPVYQRNYDWDISQCEQLCHDLFSLVEQERNSHFFGCIVRSRFKGSSADEFLIIDGQQRITTISLLFLSIYWSIKNRIITPKDDSLADKIFGKYLVDEYKQTEKKIRLKLNNDDSLVFNDIVDSGKCKAESNSKVATNYSFFLNKVKSFPYEIDKLYDAIRELVIIDIFLGEEDDPQLIFESLNSTGLALSEGDKIRNFILMDLSEELQNEYYSKYWNLIEKNCQEKNNLDNFFRDYLTARSTSGEIPSFKKLYPFFKTYSKKKGKEEILKDLLKTSNYYYKIKNATLGSQVANDIMRNINHLGMTVTYSFLINFMDYAEENHISDKDVEKVLSCIETLIFRRLICGYPTNALNKIFATLHQLVLRNKKDEDDYYSVMVYYLLNRKRGESVFPTDEEFMENFQKKPIYKMSSKNCSYILSRLENGNSKEKYDVIDSINKGNLSIEHIMPKTLTNTWRESLGLDYEHVHHQYLDTIANLTLTGYNSEYSNKSFSEKKNNENGFVKSPLRLNRYISQFDNWSEKELKERGQKLSKEALIIWPLPETSFVSTSPSSQEEEIEEISIGQENYKFSGTSIIGFKLDGLYHEVTSWSDAFLKIFKELYKKDPHILEEKILTKPDSISSQNVDYLEIADNVYITKRHGHSTTALIRDIKKYLNIYKIDHTNLLFVLRKNPHLKGYHTLYMRKHHYNLIDIGIRNGSYLEFLPINEKIKVVGEWDVEYKDKKYDLFELVWSYLGTCMGFEKGPFNEETTRELPSFSSYGLFMKSGSIFGWSTEKFFAYNGIRLDEIVKNFAKNLQDLSLDKGNAED